MNSPTPVDLVVRGGFVLTMDAALTVYYPGSLAVKGDHIVGIGPSDDLDSVFQAPRVIDAAGQVIMPGLVNAHTHIGMGYLRGMADGLKLFDWMLNVVRPIKKFAVEEDNYWHTLVGCLELIQGGITAVCDSIEHLPATIAGITEAGLRAMVSPLIIDHNDPSRDAAILQDIRACFERYHGSADGRIRVMPAVHAPYSCSSQLLQGVQELANELGLDLQIHLAESQDEHQEIFDRCGLSPTQYCDSIGFLGPNVLAAHFVCVSDQDIQIASARGIRIAHNPASNLKLASGISPLPRLLEAGLVVGLGTDSCASNNRLDQFESMKLAALIHNGTSLNPRAVSAVQALRMATREGAKAIGLDSEIGTLEIGKKADFIAVQFQDKPHLTPYFFEAPSNILSHLVYAAQSSDVDLVVVNGRILMEAGTVSSLSAEPVMATAQAGARSLFTRAGQLPSPARLEKDSA